ncbi:hypothetical protein YQE_03657, partial [Dendroctonus ponderosae]
SPVDSWLETQFKNKIGKDDSLSTIYRQEGNKCYAKKDLLKSLEFYTRSLCCATPNGKEYGLALANRSAVSFEMKEFESCLRDIELCFQSNYPKDLRPKVYIRKAECLYESGQQSNLEKCIREALKFLNGTKIVDKSERKYHSYAIFKENKELYSFKCYNCLTDIISSIPCRSCTLCVYCNENCRTFSWEECHKWECAGMQANIWYDLGIGFPAFKAALKGVKSGFNIIKGGYDEDLKHFGSKEDNYPYFNRLVSNIYKSKNAAPYIVVPKECYLNLFQMSAIIVSYLQKYTDFFSWFLQQKNCPKNNSNSLIKYVGGLITKHIAQLSCNSSIIEHWTYSSTDLLFPDILITVACGMFPSVSIMNHSCRANVTNFFICDTIVVKAIEDIEANEEIFNCYGIDYRGMNREQRQIACKSLYHFDCKCVICSDQSKEVEMLDSYICPKCRGLVPEIPNASFMFCFSCGDEDSLRTFRKKNEEAQNYLESGESNQLDILIKSLTIREQILYKHHKDFEEVYYRLYSYYVEIGDAENMFKYFHLWLENEKARRGENSRGIGTKLYEAALAILHCLKSSHPNNCTNLKSFLQNVEHMIKEAKIVLNLYYPANITNRLSKKIQFISNK